jgi:hypothetical protein
MNTRPVSTLILAAALSLSASIPLFAASKNDLPIAYSVNTVTVTSNGSMKIERGMYRGDVSWALRYKTHEELSPNVWVFSGYHANLDLANDQGCENLVVTFADDKVADLRLVNKTAAAAIAANLQRGSSARNLASR